MTEDSVSKQSDQTTKDTKADGNPGIEAKEHGDSTPTPEGQKRVTNNYRRGWDQIWRQKR